MRTLPEPRVFGSIREKLLDSFSRRYKVFFVVGFDCRLGTHEYMNESSTSQSSQCVKDYTMSSIDRALAYIGAESFEILPNRPPPRVDCSASNGMVDRHPSFWLQTHKTRRCYEAVERYERDNDMCFDWIVRSRPDDLWKNRVPSALTLPRDMVTTGQTWAWFAPLQYWESTNYTAMEDHFMAVPRRLAERALGLAPTAWWDCRSPSSYKALCPSTMLHYLQKVNLSARPTMTSECLLGLHLREHGVRWRTDPKFVYVPRRVPGGPRSEPYSRTLATYATRQPELRVAYEALERAVERQRWGELQLT